jgi:hypothetical protein
MKTVISINACLQQIAIHAQLDGIVCSHIQGHSTSLDTHYKPQARKEVTKEHSVIWYKF